MKWSGPLAQVGDHVKHLQPGQRRRPGLVFHSCMVLPAMHGRRITICAANVQATIIGRYGGFADRVRCQARGPFRFPEKIPLDKAGPLFCGGITVFNPMVQFGVKATDRVGVVGIGGLGHLALQFLNKWGCEVFAFTSNDSKLAEAIKLGAHAYRSIRATSSN